MKKAIPLVAVLALLAVPFSAAQAGGGMTVDQALSSGPAIQVGPLFSGHGVFDGDPPKDGRPCHKVVRDRPTASGRMAHWSAQQCYDGYGNAYILGGSERIDGFY